MGLVAESKEYDIISVVIDVNRSDIMHPCDIAEDLAIAYNYNLVEEVDTPSPTIGSQQFIN
jgi:phenylalanyl-tRNA synthetase beta chain